MDFTFRATCPNCGRRVPRSDYWRPGRTCCGCGAGIRPVPLLRRQGSLSRSLLFAFTFGSTTGIALLLGLALGVSLGPIGWALAVIALAVEQWASWWVYPYITPYELTRPTGICLGCGYDLRASPDRCPECGTAAEAAADLSREPQALPECGDRT